MNPLTIILFLVAASSLAVAARWAWLGHRAQSVPRRLLQGPSAQGTVIEAPSSNAETIEFTDGMGTPVTGRPAWHEGALDIREGETVTVYYDRDDPTLFIAPVREGEFRNPMARTHYIVAVGLVMSAMLVVVVALLLS